MVKRYDPAPASRLITNDLYLAAFLHCVGCTLDRVERNERRRVSFVFSGDRVAELREAYGCRASSRHRTGPVHLDMRSFRESLSHIRRLMDAEQRSLSHASRSLSTSVVSADPVLQPVPHL